MKQYLLVIALVTAANMAPLSAMKRNHDSTTTNNKMVVKKSDNKKPVTGPSEFKIIQIIGNTNDPFFKELKQDMIKHIADPIFKNEVDDLAKLLEEFKLNNEKMDLDFTL